MKNFASTMISVAASLALLVSLGACSSNGGKYKAGTYTSSAKGRNGDVEVTVTVTSSKIKSVAVSKHSETRGISDAAIKYVLAAF